MDGQPNIQSEGFACKGGGELPASNLAEQYTAVLMLACFCNIIRGNSIEARRSLLQETQFPQEYLPTHRTINVMTGKYFEASLCLLPSHTFLLVMPVNTGQEGAFQTNQPRNRADPGPDRGIPSIPARHPDGEAACKFALARAYHLILSNTSCRGVQVWKIAPLCLENNLWRQQPRYPPWLRRWFRQAIACNPNSAWMSLKGISWAEWPGSISRKRDTELASKRRVHSERFRQSCRARKTVAFLL